MTFNTLIKNAIYERQKWLSKWLDSQGRDIDKECGHPDIITIDMLKDAYQRGDIAARIVEIYPQETWQEDPEVYESEDNDKTVFEAAWDKISKEFNIYSVLQRADVLSGIGRYGVVLIGIDDGKTLDQPVEGIGETGQVMSTALSGTDVVPLFQSTPPATLVAAPVLPPRPATITTAPPVVPTIPTPKRKIIYLRTFDESEVTVRTIQADPKNPRFGQPVLYTIKFADAALTNPDGTSIQTVNTVVHWSRVIHICDNRTSSDVFGMPRLERVFNRLVDLKKIMGGAGEMFWRGGFPGLSIETQPVTNDEQIEFDRKATEEQIAQYQKGMRRYLALVGMTAKSLAPQIADPTPSMHAQIRMIAIAWAVPWRILMGAEVGQLASQQDITAWNKRVSRRQSSYITPYIILPFVKRLIMMGVLPPVADDTEIQVDWADTHTVTETDKATVAEKRTNAITKYVQGGGDLVMSPFHFLTLVLDYSDDEANSIIEKVGGALEQDRELKQALAEMAAQPAPPAGGAGNGNANGVASGSRGTAPAKKPAKAALKNQ